MVTPTGLEQQPRVATGWAGIDAAVGGGLHRGGLHVFEGDLLRSSHRAGGQAWCPPLGAAIHLAWRTLAYEHPEDGRRVGWIGREVRPSERSLLGGVRAGRLSYSSPLGLDPSNRVGGYSGVVDHRLREASFFVETAPSQPGQRLWAIEQAIRCPGVAMVVADGRGLDAAAFRRLHLAARTAADDASGDHAHAGCTGPTGTLVVLLLSSDVTARRCLSDTRWSVFPESNNASLGVPAWRVCLLRARGLHALSTSSRPLEAHCHLDWEEQHASGHSTKRIAVMRDQPAVPLNRRCSSEARQTEDACAA